MFEFFFALSQGEGKNNLFFSTHVLYHLLLFTLYINLYVQAQKNYSYLCTRAHEGGFRANTMGVEEQVHKET
jgi:hypothetical protein